MSAPKTVAKHAQNAATQYSRVKQHTAVKTRRISRQEPKETPAVAANRRFFNSISSNVVGMSPVEVGNSLKCNIEAGKARKNLEIAAAMKKDPLSSRFRKPQLYLLLLQSLAAESERKHVSLCLQLFIEMSETSASVEDLESAAKHVFQCFENCADFTQLLGLKIVYQNVIARANPSVQMAVKYLAAHMHVLLNSGQISLAMDHFHACLAQISSGPDRTVLLRELPIEKLVDAQCVAQDCDSLLDILSEVISEACTDLIAISTWTEILSTGLWKNHYDLVKLIYVNVIMDGLDSVAVTDAVLEIGILQNNRFLPSLSQHTVSQILHTLAAHGDVASCLNLIEWHFFHKSMRGESALTKDLCLRIITAYCHYNPKAGELADHTDEDNSVKTVLDVIDTLVAKKKFRFEYRDLVDAFSHKLNTYHKFDAKVAHAVAKEQSGPWKQTNFVPGEEIPEDEEEILTKKSNRNVHESAQGSVLKNTSVLSEFITEHLHHLTSRNHCPETRLIFVNCLLAHLAIYQNTTGVISALNVMKQVEPNFLAKWLDQASCDIIIKSFAESPAAMATGLAFYEFMKQRGLSVSSKNFKHLVFSSLRGDAYNQLLEYYVFEYLQSKPEQEHISAHLMSRIRKFKNLNEDGKSLLRCLENYSSEDHHRLCEIWDTNQFTRVEPVIQAPGDEYSFYFKIDQRDKRMLEQILA